jgi:hypothetical protein
MFMKNTNYIRACLRWCTGSHVASEIEYLFQRTTKETRVKNLVDLVLFVGRELDGWWRRRMLIGDSREIIRFEKSDMKYIVNTKVG